jgi:hypothetical protein
MDYRITLMKGWRPDRRLIHPGTYRVPEDMSHADAERALKEAGAEKLTPQSRVTQNIVEPEVPPKKKARGRPPENK